MFLRIKRGITFRTSLLIGLSSGIFATTPVVFGQPSPSVAAALNSASYADVELPHGKLAKGSIFSIFGVSLAAGQSVVTQFPLTTRLGETEVEIAVGATVRRALPLFVSPSQINAILPSDTPAGAGQLTVIRGSARSAPLAVEIANHAPGIYTLRGTGAGPGIFTDPLDVNPNTRINSGIRAAHVGERWDIWATGLGGIPTSDTVAAPFFDRTDLDVKVLVGGKEAVLEYRGRSGCCSGLDQIRFLVPEGVEGCCVPVSLVVNGVASNPVSISITGAGKRLCETDLLANVPDELVRLFNGEEEFRSGSIALQRVRTFTSLQGGRLSESATAAFSSFRFLTPILDPCPTEQEPGEPGEPSTFVTGPCTVVRPDATIALDLDGNVLARSGTGAASLTEAFRATQRIPSPIPENKLLETFVAQAEAAWDEINQGLPGFPFRYLDAGPSISLDGPNGPWTLSKGPDILGIGAPYSVEITDDQSFTGSQGGKLGQGVYTFRAPGGADLGAFSAEVSTVGLEWTNFAEAFPEIPRDRPLRLSWGGQAADASIVAVSGTSVPVSATAGFSFFSCIADFARGGLTLHPNLLREMYASGPDGGALGVSVGAGKIEALAGIENVSRIYGETTIVQAPYTGQGVEPPTLRFRVKVDPVYPAAARQAGIEGTVLVLAQVNQDGSLTPFAIQGPEALTPAVAAVVPQWRVEGAGLIPIVQVEVVFSLRDGVICRFKDLTS